MKFSVCMCENVRACVYVCEICVDEVRDEGATGITARWRRDDCVCSARVICALWESTHMSADKYTHIEAHGARTHTCAGVHE